MSGPLLRTASAGALLMLGACAQLPPPVVIDARRLTVAVPVDAAVSFREEDDEVVATPLPQPRAPRRVAPPEVVYVPGRFADPVRIYPPDPVVRRPPCCDGGSWIPVVE